VTHQVREVLFDVIKLILRRAIQPITTTTTALDNPPHLSQCGNDSGDEGDRYGDIGCPLPKCVNWVLIAEDSHKEDGQPIPLYHTGQRRSRVVVVITTITTTTTTTMRVRFGVVVHHIEP